MKDNKVKFYRKEININMLIFLFLSIIAMIFGIISKTDEGINLFLRSFIYMIPILVLLINWNKLEKFIGNLSIIVSIIMILFGIFNLTVFDILFILFGLFNIFNSIKYLSEFSKYKSSMKEQESSKKTNFVWYNIVILLLPLIGLIISIFLEKDVNYTQNIVSILIFLSSIFVIVNCIYFFIKKYKLTLLYVEFIIAILMFLLFILTFASKIELNNLKNKYINLDNYNEIVVKEMNILNNKRI